MIRRLALRACVQVAAGSLALVAVFTAGLLAPVPAPVSLTETVTLEAAP